MRNICSKLIERGKVDVIISIESKDSDKSLAVHKALAKTYYNELKQLASELKAPENELLAMVLKMPEVMRQEAQELSVAEENLLKTCLEKAIADFSSFRLAEGNVLEEDFHNRIKIISSLLKDVEKLDKARSTNLRKRIEKNLEELIQKDRIDQNRLEQELIFYIEKMDITEEKLRLKTHCDYFLKTMKEEESVGRKLGFITQEIGREINTIGSKANDSAIQKVVVQMKDELEKVKEQLLNVL